MKESESNRLVFEARDVVQRYVEAGDKLKTAEAAILHRLAPDLRGACLLDLGVGAGRTTPHLLAISSDYIGVDYSAEMIVRCRTKYPGIHFEEGDARRLEAFGREKYDFVIFSFNGLDAIDHAGRAQVLAEVYAALRPGGRFLFCSHNLQVPPERPWQLGLYQWSLNPRTLLRTLGSLVRGVRNYRRHASGQHQGQGYAVWIDSGHDFQMLHYYIDPAEQVRRLAAAGFVDIEVFDRQGELREPGAPELSVTGHVHYLARRPTEPQ